MAKATVNFNHATLMDFLAENYSDELAAVTKSVAASVDVPDDVEVITKVDRDRTGRPRGMVTIAHPGGLAMQAKHGVLTKAAAENGLDIRRYEIGDS
ncbi:hypothetical protein ACQX2E_09580 [Corynebacterium diphtheriae]